MNSYNEHTDYKLTDLDYLTGDHHLQMMKAALPFLNVPQQRTLSMFVKIQEREEEKSEKKKKEFFQNENRGA